MTDNKDCNPNIGKWNERIKSMIAHISTEREAWIPAVVGCGNTTMNLKTGDRICADGGKSIVTLLNGGNNGKQQ